MSISLSSHPTMPDMGRGAPALFDFDAIRLRIASPQDILAWSHGEVIKPETINYRTQKPERDGLFSEVIFGPTKDWECYCGKYKRIRYKGIVCDKCGVEVTRALVRRERMGHITLATPIAHIWFVRGVPSKIGMVLDISMQELEKVIYFASYVVTDVNEALKQETLVQIQQEYKAKKKALESQAQKEGNDLAVRREKMIAEGGLKEEAESGYAKEHAKLAKIQDERVDELEMAVKIACQELEDLQPLAVISEQTYQDLSLKYGHLFEAGIGATAIHTLLARIDLDMEVEALKDEAGDGSSVKQRKLLRRVRLLQSLKKNEIRPEWMVMTHLPVLPPDLRPMVQLDGGRFATSDLNDLYRRVINRNNRLKRLQDLNAPEVITRNEKRMLQEAVDALLDNGARHGKTVTASTGQRRVLKSIADMLKGKQGRFRQNLLGKRIDYSGRSVIVVGPTLKLHQCGLPKIMALELFKPFVISQLIKQELVHNVRSATRYIESGASEVWDILEHIINSAYVLLNRAPTLHRLGIQAFQPVLIEGKAIQVHPLVCSAFNADFDGDQMAVHVPLTEEARWEAANIMLSSKNLLKPATGDPIATPNQDMVLGCYYMTQMVADDAGERARWWFSSPQEAKMAYERGRIRLQTRISLVINGAFLETTVGRVLFNEILPEGLRFVNTQQDKKSLRKLIALCLEQLGTDQAAMLLDDMMQLSFRYITHSGLSWGMDDLPLLSQKKVLISVAQKQVDTVEEQYAMGLLTDKERHDKVIEIWANMKDQVTALSRDVLRAQPENPVYAMIESGARGSWGQTTQMIGMKGLVTSPSGETIELPIQASFKEGFDVLEYFIATHGARKGLTDTALRTANAGYLTRRLVDISQDVVVTSQDCKDIVGVIFTKAESDAIGKGLGERVRGRFVMDVVKDTSSGEVIVKKGELISNQAAKHIDAISVSAIRIRSVLTCQSPRGVCQKCYGIDLGYNKAVALGTAVGIIAAQSIGEPGTQLTMRTFHTGGVAGSDITQGLPRVEEIFEARQIQNGAILSEIVGTAKIIEEGRQVSIQITSQDGKDVKTYKVLSNFSAIVKDGELVNVGQCLTEGNIDLQSLSTLQGYEAVQKYIMKEIQQIYSSQGQDLNDKHIEVICRQMFSRCYISDEGDTDLLAGSIVERSAIEESNAEVRVKGGALAVFQPLLMGVTKASLATSSFLSAASFQETARVLIDAAVTGKVDRLIGLKENVIIGRLIPAGTGFSSSRLSSMTAADRADEAE